MSQNPVFFVDGPPPVPPRYRLLDTANIVAEPDNHWLLGARVWPYSADIPEGWDPCSTGTFRVKPEGGAVDNPEFGMFAVVVGETCSSFTVHDQASFERRATAVFAARESFAVEAELATGNALSDAFPYLTDNPTLLNGGAATVPGEALSFLEDAVGATGSGGVLHVTPGVATAWTELDVHDENGVLTTTVGNRVVVSGAYIGVKPDNSPGALAAGQSWAFATGPIDVRRGSVDLVPGDISEALDRSINEITYRVERPYLLTWDPSFLVAIKIDWTA